MTWCDKLASTPSVGIRLNPHFLSSDTILTALAPILDPGASEHETGLSVDGYEPFNVIVSTDIGLRYQIDSSKIAVAFNHRMRALNVSAGLPIVQMVSEAKPYSELLPQISKALQKATFLLPGSSDRLLNRVGVVSLTNVNVEEAPPGIRKLVAYMSRPWTQIDAFNYTVTGEVGTEDGWRDRCTHTIIKHEDESKPATMQFDWQRTFLEPRRLTEDRLRTALDGAQRDSTEYFERLAEGGMFDVDSST